MRLTPNEEGSSLYTSLSNNVSDLTVLRIVTSIGARKVHRSEPAGLFSDPSYVLTVSGGHGGGYGLNQLGSFHGSKPGILRDAE